jgi:hypothetical protein
LIRADKKSDSKSIQEATIRAVERSSRPPDLDKNYCDEPLDFTLWKRYFCPFHSFLAAFAQAIIPQKEEV